VSTARLLTAPTAGAVAVIEVRGDCQHACDALAGQLPPVGSIRLVHCPEIDDMLLARPTTDTLYVMPHGGRQIVDATLTRLASAGIETAPTATAPVGDIEAAMLEDLPSAQTSVALDLLLAQPRRWASFSAPWTEEDEARSTRLRHLLDPPSVAVVGPPNIGKSTLLNALAGRQRAVVADAPGTTRDWVGARVDVGGLLVDWIDTPGLRATGDMVEAASINMARAAIANADVLIAAADPHAGWPEVPRPADLRLGLREDLGPIEGASVTCAALRGKGLERVVAAVRAVLIRDEDLASERPWRWRARSPIPGQPS